MKGSNLISALKTKFRVNTDVALANRLGISTQAIQGWKNRKKITIRQLVGLVHSSSSAGASNLQTKAIRPLVEFFRIEKCDSKQGAKYEIFGINTGDGDKHPYLDGLRKELEKNKGVYIFFDSRGQAIYTGKARRNLWKEMNLAFNRERGEVQKIKRVNHPARKQPYRTNEEKARQITAYEVPLYELASYFSAYQIADSLINKVEAMLIRSFANDLLNKKMERFGQQKRKKKHE